MSNEKKIEINSNIFHISRLPQNESNETAFISNEIVQLILIAAKARQQIIATIMNITAAVVVAAITTTTNYLCLAIGMTIVFICDMNKAQAKCGGTCHI